MLNIAKKKGIETNNIPCAKRFRYEKQNAMRLKNYSHSSM